MTKGSGPGLPSTRNLSHEQAVVSAVDCPFCKVPPYTRCVSAKSNAPRMCHVSRYKAAAAAGVDLRTVRS